jgi:hypothetical protein
MLDAREDKMALVTLLAVFRNDARSIEQIA